MDKIRIKLKCEEVGLEKLLLFQRKRIPHMPEGVAFPENLGFIPPKGTTLTLKGFGPKLNGVYKVKKIKGNIDVMPGDKNYGDEVEVQFLDDYVIELKKIA